MAQSLTKESCSYRGSQESECEGRSQAGRHTLRGDTPIDLAPLTRPYLLTASQLWHPYNSISLQKPQHKQVLGGTLNLYHNIPLLAPKRLIHYLFMQNAFSTSLRVAKVLTALLKVQVQSFLSALRALLAVSPYENQNKVKHC